MEFVKDQTLEALLVEADKNVNALKPVLGRLSDIAADSNAPVIEHYMDRVNTICEKWEKEFPVVTGIKFANNALANFYLTNFLEANKSGLKALALLEKGGDNEILGVTHMLIGATSRSMGKIDVAVDHLMQGADLISVEGELGIYKAYCYYQLGEIHVYFQDPDQAEKYYQKSVDIVTMLQNERAAFRAYNGMANYYISAGIHDKAFEFLDKSLKLKTLSVSQKGRSLCDLARYYYNIGDLESSLKTAQESYDLRMDVGLIDAATTSLIQLAKTQKALGAHEDALKSAKIGLENSLKHGSKSKSLELYKLLGELYEQDGHYKEAVAAYKAYDQLQLEQNTKQLQNVYKMKNDQINRQKVVIEKIHEEIKDSIRYAQRIQNAILPSVSSLGTSSDAFVLYKPKDIVAGDFYWIQQLDDTLLFASCDCTGHGVPGAMMSVVCYNALNRAVREFELQEPGKILDKTREIVLKEFEMSDSDVKDGMDIALCSLSQSTLKLSFAGANNPLWIIRSGSDDIEEVSADKQPIGQTYRPFPFTTHNLNLKQGDTLYIFSDGYADQFGGDRGKKFKKSNFKQLLLSIQHEPMTRQKEILDQTFERWRGELEQLDDVCVIGVKV